MQRSVINRTRWLILYLPIVWLIACVQQHELDEYGGYYDEKLQQYIYVRPGNRSSANNTLGVKAPGQGDVQTFEAKIVEIDGTDGVWIEIGDRQGYMLLAQRMLRSYKDDKNKKLLVKLKFVKPTLTQFANKSIKQRWLTYVSQNLEKFFLGKKAMVQVEYLKPGVLKGLVFVDYEGKKINISLWMISEGLSLYVKEYKDNPDEALYVEYQNKANIQKKGLWKM